MMDLILRCNNHANGFCRKELRNEAFVTTCSHVFCRDCVQKYGFLDLNPKRECLACSISLASIGDVVHANLRPSEEQQSTMLSGLVPNTIMDCAARAVKFWNYQMSTEIAWQEHLVKEMTARYQGLHTNARKVVDEANNEIGELQRQIETLTLEKKDLERRSDELVASHKEKSKHCAQMTHLYDTLKAKVQAEQARDLAAVSAENTLQSMGPISMPEPYPSHQFPHLQQRNVLGSPRTRLTPSKLRHSTDQYGVEQLHPFQRTGSATRLQTSSELAGPTISMRPPMQPVPGRQTISRLTTGTPAQRVTLNRPSASHTFSQSVHRPSMSEQFAPRTIDRHAMEAYHTSRGDQYASRRNTGLAPNVHSRMPANRGPC